MQRNYAMLLCNATLQRHYFVYTTITTTTLYTNPEMSDKTRNEWQKHPIIYTTITTTTLYRNPYKERNNNKWVTKIILYLHAIYYIIYRNPEMSDKTRNDWQFNHTINTCNYARINTSPTIKCMQKKIFILSLKI